MHKKTSQEYANELINLYRKNAKELNNTLPTNSQITANDNVTFEDGTGGIQVNVTTLSRLYPVKDALITVFSGDTANMNIIETGITDQNGKSNVFNVKTPPRSISQQAQNSDIAYAQYNISVKSDGYVEQIAMNVPVFSGVISVQGIDLLPVSAAGGHTAPQIIEEGNKYNL